MSDRKTVKLNSLLRLDHQVNQVKNELVEAHKDGQKALSLAKDKLLDSPNTNKTFKKTVAKRVDFQANEKIFNQLTSLDISEAKVLKKSKAPIKNDFKRDIEPRLSDFHEPFQGEPMPSVQDPKEITERIIRKLYSNNEPKIARPQFQDKFSPY